MLGSRSWTKSRISNSSNSSPFSHIWHISPHTVDVAIPTPVHLYNHSMGGVDLNDQLRSYYPSGRSGKKWWRFIFWYLLDVSICNAFIVEGQSSHRASSRSRRSLLSFKLELAKQLIGGFCGRKKYAGKKRKSTNLDNALSLPNLPGHREVKLEGRKGACINCSVCGRRNPSAVLRKLYLDVIGVGSISVVVGASWSIIQRIHMCKSVTFMYHQFVPLPLFYVYLNAPPITFSS